MSSTSAYNRTSSYNRTYEKRIIEQGPKITGMGSPLHVSSMGSPLHVSTSSYQVLLFASTLIPKFPIFALLFHEINIYIC